MDSVPRVGDKWKQDVAMPDMEDKEYSVTHCKFAGRCPYVTDECVKTRPHMVNLGGEREVLCYHPLTKNA
jgi:peptide/nickel transport system ATP-binding protein